MVSEADVASVRKSFGRVMAKGRFVERFYEVLFKSNPGIGKLFAKTDLKKQSEVLEQSLSMALLFPQGNPIAKQVVERIRKSHSRDQLNIEPSLYKFWLDSLMQVVAESDPDFSPALDQQWRRVLQVTLDHIAAGY